MIGNEENPSASDITAQNFLHLNWFTVMMGAILATAGFSQTFNLSLAWYWLLLGFACYWIVGFYVAGSLMEKAIIPHLQVRKPLQRSLWLLSCISAGFLLIILIPLTVYPKPQIVKIRATGEKNINSQGSEVWLREIIAGDYESPAFLRSCDGPWVQQGENLVSYFNQQPSTLTCNVRSDDNLIIRFGTHPWSGKMELLYNGSHVKEDLYSNEFGSVEINLEVSLSRIDRIVWWIFFFAIGISLGFLLVAVSLLMSQDHRRPTASFSVSSIPWYVYASIFIITWLFLLLVYWPGFFGYDILNQFQQIEAGQFSEWHPIFHTLFLWLTTLIAFTPTPAIVIQIISLGFLLGWGLSILESRGAPRWMTLGSAVYLALSPAVGLAILNPWKDIAYAISIVAFAVFFFYWSGNNYVTPKGWKAVVILIFIVLGIALFRYNGPPVIAGVLLFLFMVDRKLRRTILWVSIFSSAIWMVIRGPGYNLLDTNNVTDRESGKNLVPYSEAVYLSRWHLKLGTDFSPQDERLLIELVNEDNALDLTLLRQKSEYIRNLAINATLEQPGVTLQYFMRKASFIFQILQPPDRNFGYIWMRIEENPYGIQLDSKIPGLMPYISKIKEITESPELDWLVWRNGFWMYLLILAGVTTSIRLKDWTYFTFALLAVLNALPYSFVGSPQGRYILPTILLGPLFGVCLLFVRSKDREHEEQSQVVSEK